MNSKHAKNLRRAVKGYADLMSLAPETLYTVQWHRNGHGTVVTKADCVRGFYRRAKRDEIRK